MISNLLAEGIDARKSEIQEDGGGGTPVNGGERKNEKSRLETKRLFLFVCGECDYSSEKRFSKRSPAAIFAASFWTSCAVTVLITAS